MSFKDCLKKVLEYTEMTSSVEDTWTLLKSCLLNSAERASGKSKKRPPRKETWWWNHDVNTVVLNNRKLWREWKKGGSKEPYLEAKRQAKHAVYLAKRCAEEKELPNLKDGKDNIYRIAK